MGAATALIAGQVWSAGAAAEPSHPPINAHYVQYGVGLASEFVASPADVCPEGASAPCILGSGGGLALRVGYRSRDPWYIGGAYEFSRHDASNLLRLALMQQVRAETRYYWRRNQRLSPYAMGQLGLVVYGNEFGSDTAGISALLGPGVEFQVSRTTLVGAAMGYRVLLLRGWTDTADQRRADRFLGFGLAHFISLELTLEVRRPLARW